MKKTKSIWIALAILVMLSTAVLGCSSGNTNTNQAGDTSTPEKTESTNGAAASNTDKAAEQAADQGVRSYTDYKNHTVNIPVAPQRVVFAGETTGDLVELGINPVGIFGDTVSRTLYADKLASVEDVGFPISLEKVLSLNPDLILVADTDEAAYEKLAQIAPTIMFNTFGTLDDRITELGDIFGKEQEASQWLANYNTQVAEMWKQLHAAGVNPGETASVFTYYPGNRLFVMAISGLPQLLYGEDGFKPTAGIQEILDANEGFRQISPEAIQELAGDHIFILDPVAEEAKKSTESLMSSSVWETLPAVKKGHVYRLEIEKSNADAYTRREMLQELPKLLNNK
ncbi:Iron(3+)-hydroxamate-binding protein YxeB precursor [compost metagenome]